MNKCKLILVALTFLAVLSWSCESDDIGEISIPAVPANVALEFEIDTNPNGDTTGLVTFTPSAEGVLNFHLFFGDVADERPTVVRPGATASHTYSAAGIYSVRLVAFTAGGIGSSITQELEVLGVAIDPTILTLLTGGTENSSKRWVWRSNVGGVNGHFGVGAPDGPEGGFPGFFSAPARGAEGALDEPNCIYDDVLIFSVEDQVPIYELETMGDTFINWADVPTLFPGATPIEFDDECRPSDDVLNLRVPFGIASDPDGTLNLILTALTPLSYYVNASEWRILELTEDILRVRGIQQPQNLAWYFTFVPEGSLGRPNFSNMIFAEEFDTDGAPDPTVWNFDLGDGCPDLCGWGNNELQTYTDRSENVVIENGMLKITALRESFDGREFTSARLTTKDNFEFTYGRVDVRARVPATGGTWPAAWMLGADIDTNPWPAAGEIDIMEHVGNNANTILGSVHSPSGFAGDASTGETPVPDATSEFHVYSIDWTETAISFYVDDRLYHTYSPSERNAETYPFDKDFFLLVNMAIGGNLGGDVDPGLMEEVYEIDYIRVYQ